MKYTVIRGRSRAAATSKLERFVIIVITKRSILDVLAALDPPVTWTQLQRGLTPVKCP